MVQYLQGGIRSKMIELNLKQEEIDKIKENLREYRLEKRELEFKHNHGMPMSIEEEDRLSKIDAIISQAEYTIEWYESVDEEDGMDLWEFD